MERIHGGAMKEPKEIRKGHANCVGNQKGGVGKTTNFVQLAAAFIERGKKYLIIDIDMTAGATIHSMDSGGMVTARSNLAAYLPTTAVLPSQLLATQYISSWHTT